MMIDITVQTPKIDIENPNRGETGRDGIGIHYMGEINEYNELPLTAEEGDAYYWAGKLYIFKDDEFRQKIKVYNIRDHKVRKGRRVLLGNKVFKGNKVFRGKHLRFQKYINL